MTLISRKLEAVALMNEGLTNPQIADVMGIKTSQAGYLLHEARKAGFKFGINLSSKQRRINKQREQV